MLTRISKYQVMWILVNFDLPTETKKHRKAYAQFRKFLLDDGFNMMQFSMYARHCSSRENAKVHVSRVKKQLPEYGKVIVLEITDAQFDRMEFFYGKKKTILSNHPKQLELF